MVFLRHKPTKMKSTTLLFLGFLLMLSACKNPNADKVSVDINSDTTKAGAMRDTMADNDDGKFVEVDSATMMKAWMDFATPGDMHKWMAKYDGTWVGDVTMWMDPEEPPTKSTATIKQKMAMNGLYQIGDYTGTMMGQPFMGHSILAYDNAKKEFVNTWIDNMGSGIVIMRGTYDPATQTLRLAGSQTNPVNAKDSAMREEVKFVDDNTQMMTMYGEGPDGKEHKFMEITLKRKV